MKNGRVRTYWLSLATLLTIAAGIPPYYSRAAEKMRPEEVVAKHLDSIASAETRASVHSRIVVSSVVATFRSPGVAKFSGQGIMASDGNKNMIRMGFETAGKFQEGFGFDGKDVTVGFARPGVRGHWGDFLLTHPNIIKEGLLGGVLSDAWPLLNSSDKKPKLDYRGIKKVGEKSVHEVKYVPKGSSDLEISLFFDSETFQHSRTEYTRVISAGLGGGIDASGQQRTTRYKMFEDFSDFKKESGLTLPHTYKVGLELESRGGGTFFADWVFTLTDFAFNQAIPPGSFNANPK